MNFKNSKISKKETDFSKLRAALILQCENYICSACENPYDKAAKIKAASEDELLKMAEASHFDLSKFTI